MLHIYIILKYNVYTINTYFPGTATFSLLSFRSRTYFAFIFWFPLSAGWQWFGGAGRSVLSMPSSIFLLKNKDKERIETQCFESQ